MKKATLILIAILYSCVSWAQPSAENNLVQQLQGHASFNVVFAVVLVILLGILYYLFRLDRRVSKMENEIKK